MAPKLMSLNDMFADREAELKAEAERDDTDQAAARRAARRAAHHDKGVRLGWWDVDGNPIGFSDEPEPDDDQEDDQEED